MELLSDGTRRALTRWDGRPRQIAALLCAALAALLALTGGGEDVDRGAGSAASVDGTAGAGPLTAL
ncbi:MAG: hypothetical protein JWN61_2025, partial [Pseudonocardiales bacterium]|nr:hypothetical protein [Pseudonocardiales bacterium]